MDFETLTMGELRQLSVDRGLAPNKKTKEGLITILQEDWDYYGELIAVKPSECQLGSWYVPSRRGHLLNPSFRYIPFNCSNLYTHPYAHPNYGPGYIFKVVDPRFRATREALGVKAGDKIIDPYGDVLTAKEILVGYSGTKGWVTFENVKSYQTVELFRAAQKRSEPDTTSYETRFFMYEHDKPLFGV